jgi:hypothetical protein
MKQTWTMRIYRRDRRCRTGQRLFGVTVWHGRDRPAMQREVQELAHLYPASQFRLEFCPATAG